MAVREVLIAAKRQVISAEEAEHLMTKCSETILQPLFPRHHQKIRRKTQTYMSMK